MATLQAALAELFPDDASDLLRLCTRELNYPLGFDHVAILAELANVELSPSEAADFRTSYVLLSAYYFLLDATTDGHLADPLDTLYLSHLLTGACTKLADACCERTPDRVQRVQAAVRAYVSRNAHAMRLEASLHQHPLDPAEEEEQISITGRSCSFLLYYEVFSILNSTSVDSRVYSALSDVLVGIQLADDLTDWEKDFSARRWTSTLRICASRLGRIPSRDELEDFICFGGYCEEATARIIQVLTNALQQLDGLERVNSTLARAFVQRQIDNLIKALTGIVALKLEPESATAEAQ